MGSPATETWWNSWLNIHGKDSTEEKAFLGYLITHEIASDSDPAVLEEAYAAFAVFLETSQGAPEGAPTATSATSSGDDDTASKDADEAADPKPEPEDHRSSRRRY